LFNMTPFEWMTGFYILRRFFAKDLIKKFGLESITRPNDTEVLGSKRFAGPNIPGNVDGPLENATSLLGLLKLERWMTKCFKGTICFPNQCFQFIWFKGKGAVNAAVCPAQGKVLLNYTCSQCYRSYRNPDSQGVI